MGLTAPFVTEVEEHCARQTIRQPKQEGSMIDREER